MQFICILYRQNYTSKTAKMRSCDKLLQQWHWRGAAQVNTVYSLFIIFCCILCVISPLSVADKLQFILIITSRLRCIYCYADTWASIRGACGDMSPKFGVEGTLSIINRCNVIVIKTISIAQSTVQTAARATAELHLDRCPSPKKKKISACYVIYDIVI